MKRHFGVFLVGFSAALVPTLIGGWRSATRSPRIGGPSDTVTVAIDLNPGEARLNVVWRRTLSPEGLADAWGLTGAVGLFHFRDTLFVADGPEHRILKFSALTGESAGSLGAFGQGDRQFRGPSAVVVDGDDAWVSDPGNRRLVRISRAQRDTSVALEYVPRLLNVSDDSVYVGTFGGAHGWRIYAIDKGSNSVVRVHGIPSYGTMRSFARATDGTIAVVGRGESIDLYPGSGNAPVAIRVNARIKRAAASSDSLLNRTVTEAVPSGRGANSWMVSINDFLVCLDVKEARVTNVWRVPGTSRFPSITGMVAVRDGIVAYHVAENALVRYRAACSA